MECSSCPRLYITAAVAINTQAWAVTATDSYFTDHRGEEQLKGKTGVRATE